MTTLVVLAKAPVPGRSKTRLSPPCTPVEAAQVADAALRDSLDVACRTAADRVVLVLDGGPFGGMDPAIEVVAQRGDGLGERLAAAFADVGGPILLIGMDTPQVEVALLDTALAQVDRAVPVLGPASDGGWWALGLPRCPAGAFDGVPMSSSFTAAVQRERLAACGVDVVSLPELLDVDHWADAIEVAALVPTGRFAPRGPGRRASARTGDDVSVIDPLPPVVLRGGAGKAVPGERWLGPADGVDHRLLDRCVGPVLDVGCGPGRHTVALAERGVPVLGVDITESLLAVARPRGAVVMRRSVFDRVPGTGRWGTALVLDANLGIGGDLAVLLGRLHELVRPGGLVLAEPAAGPGLGPARVEVGGAVGPWFPWVEVDEPTLLGAVETHGGFLVQDCWVDLGRTFVALTRAPSR